MSSNNRKLPTGYNSPKISSVSIFYFARDPTGTDFRNPFNNSKYSVGDEWCNSANGTVWKLFSIIANVADWVLLGAGTPSLLNITVPLGVSPIVPNGSGTVALTSNASTIAITGIGTNQINFDLVGGSVGADSFQVQAVTAPGVNPVVPTALGLLTVNASAVAAHSVPVETRSRALNAYNVEIQYASAVAATDATKSGLSHYNSAQFTTDANGFVSLVGGVGPPGETITGDTGGALNPSGGNWNIVGGAPLSSGTNGSVTSGSGSTLTVTSINCAKWIVDPIAGRGTHQTITAATAAASSGETIFIRPGTYTESYTSKPGVNYCSFGSESSVNGTGHVIISGTVAMTGAGTCTYSGIQFQTNGAAAIALTGSAASVLNAENCYINGTNATPITYSSSNAASGINFVNCNGDLGTTGIALYNHSSAGRLNFRFGVYGNSGGSTTASTVSAGSIAAISSNFSNPVTTSGASAALIAENSEWSTGNTTCLNLNSTGGGGHTLLACNFTSGSASAISIGAGAMSNILKPTVASTNANAITGAGSLGYSGINFSSTSKNIDTVTRQDSDAVSFTPTISFGGASTGITYAFQLGICKRVDSFVFFTILIELTSKGSATGNATLAGLPLTAGGLQTFFPVYGTNVTPLAGYIYLGGQVIGGASEIVLFQGAAPLQTQIGHTNFANNSSLQISGFYIV